MQSRLNSNSLHCWGWRYISALPPAPEWQVWGNQPSLERCRGWIYTCAIIYGAVGVKTSSIIHQNTSLLITRKIPITPPLSWQAKILWIHKPKHSTPFWSQVWGCTTFIPALGRQKKVDLWVQASLVYELNSRIATATQKKPVSKNQVGWGVGGIQLTFTTAFANFQPNSKMAVSLS